MKRDFFIIAGQGFGKSEMARILSRDDKKVMTYGSNFISLEKLPEGVDTIIIDEYSPLHHRGMIAAKEFTKGRSGVKYVRPRVIALTNDLNVKLPAGFVPFMELENGGLTMKRNEAEDIGFIMSDSRIALLTNALEAGEILKVYANGFDTD